MVDPPSLGNMRDSVTDELTPERLKSPKFKKVHSAQLEDIYMQQHFRSDEKPRIKASGGGNSGEKGTMGKIPHAFSQGVLVQGLAGSGGGSDPPVKNSLTVAARRDNVMVSGFNPGSPVTFGGSERRRKGLDTLGQKKQLLKQGTGKKDAILKSLEAGSNSNSNQIDEMMIKEEEDFTDVVQVYRSSLGSGSSNYSASGKKQSPFLAQLNQPHTSMFEA